MIIVYVEWLLVDYKVFVIWSIKICNYVGCVLFVIKCDLICLDIRIKILWKMLN